MDAELKNRSPRLTPSPPPAPATKNGQAMPADALLGPVPLIAILILVANDHWFKSMWPGVVTGKLSDIAGLAFFPFVPLGFWELALWAARRWRGPRTTPLMFATAITAVGFVLVKTTAVGAMAFGTAESFGQWLPVALIGVFSGHRPAIGDAAPVARDISDLLALPALLLALNVGLARIRRMPKVRSSSKVEPPARVGCS
jgi:hypothetical protein